jgi:SUMO ligase MMS21 Smc5/6 complex component
MLLFGWFVVDKQKTHSHIVGQQTTTCFFPVQYTTTIIYNGRRGPYLSMAYGLWMHEEINASARSQLEPERQFPSNSYI